jgi:hypothetical protein
LNLRRRADAEAAFVAEGVADESAGRVETHVSVARHGAEAPVAEALVAEVVIS